MSQIWLIMCLFSDWMKLPCVDIDCRERPGAVCGCLQCLSWAQWLSSICWPDLGTEGLNVCVSLLFEVGQIALTSLLRRAAGIESSFKQPLPPLTVTRLSSIDAQSQRLPRQPLVPAPGLWPSANTRCWPVTHIAEMCFQDWQDQSYLPPKSSEDIPTVSWSTATFPDSCCCLIFSHCLPSPFLRLIGMYQIRGQLQSNELW